MGRCLYPTVNAKDTSGYQAFGSTDNRLGSLLELGHKPPDSGGDSFILLGIGVFGSFALMDMPSSILYSTPSLYSGGPDRIFQVRGVRILGGLGRLRQYQSRPFVPNERTPQSR